MRRTIEESQVIIDNFASSRLSATAFCKDPVYEDVLVQIRSDLDMLYSKVFDSYQRFALIT